MDIKKTTTFILDENELKIMLAEYFSKEQGINITPDMINMNVGRRTIGYGYDEHEELYFKNAVITVHE